MRSEPVGAEQGYGLESAVRTHMNRSPHGLAHARPGTLHRPPHGSGRAGGINGPATRLSYQKTECKYAAQEASQSIRGYPAPVVTIGIHESASAPILMSIHVVII